MVLNTGLRTDIPAFFTKWFLNRIRAGFVLTRNPYNPLQVTRYRLDPEVVDVLVFGTKNPLPLVAHLGELKAFHMYWFVTVNPYGPRLEPRVPPAEKVFAGMRALAQKLGAQAVCWRYSPVIVNDEYSIAWHKEQFERLASLADGCCESCMIAFLDLYGKTVRNFPEGRLVTPEEKASIGADLNRSRRRTGSGSSAAMRIRILQSTALTFQAA